MMQCPPPAWGLKAIWPQNILKMLQNRNRGDLALLLVSKSYILCPEFYKVGVVTMPINTQALHHAANTFFGALSQQDPDSQQALTQNSTLSEQWGSLCSLLKQADLQFNTLRQTLLIEPADAVLASLQALQAQLTTQANGQQSLRDPLETFLHAIQSLKEQLPAPQIAPIVPAADSFGRKTHFGTVQHLSVSNEPKQVQRCSPIPE